MAAPVAYVATTDGVRIAYATRGRGPVVVSMSPLPFRHIELEWESPEDRRWLEWLASRYTVVQYDPRGLGLSDRTAMPDSNDALLADLEAVVEALGVERVALFAAVNTTPLAIGFAARHPERVSHLILWCGSPRGTEGLGSHFEALLGLIEQDWEVATETLAHLLRGWSAGESARRLAAMARASTSPEAIRALVRIARESDVTDLLPTLRSPTLVLHRRGVTWVPVDRAVELASRIPGARLVLLEGDSMAPWVGDVSAVERTVAEFLGGRVPDDVAATVPTPAFRSEGEYWTLAFDGRLCRMRDAKGLRHLAELLRRPGVAVAAVELLGTSRNVASALGDAGPLLDTQAKDAYRRRLVELRADLAEAERFNDTGHAAAARREMDAIGSALAGAVGLGGRDRRAASAAERARLTVTKRIKDTLARIRRAHPALGAHLDHTVKTGLVCTYVPDPDDAPRWSF